MADTYEAFLAEVLAEVPADRRGAVEGALKDEKLAPKIRERVLARSDYSRNMDRLKQEREQFQREVTEARGRISGWQNWYEQTSKQAAELQRQNEAYKSQFGELEGGERVVTKPGVTQEEIDARLRREFDQRDSSAIAFADALTEIKLDHRETFKEKLDTQALIRFATEKGLPIDTAYREFVAPRMEEKRQKEVDDKIAAAREEGRRQALSEHKLPGLSSHGEIHTLDRVEKVGKTAGDRVRAATEHWNEQGNHSYF